MATLRLALLGPPTIAHADVASNFPTRKALALLVYLAVEGGRHSRDKLTAVFWPDSDRPHGRAMLRYSLSSLRRALSDSKGAAHLIVEGDAIGLDLNSGLEIDLHGLEKAHLAGPADLTAFRQAAEICRGEFLEGFTLPDAPDFDDWSCLKREGYRREMERVLGGLSQLEAEQGQLVEAVETPGGGWRSVR
jgi:DNA-binding SARP family transcriptional activator